MRFSSRSVPAVTLAFAALLASSSRATAHDFWIEPSSFHPAPGTAVTSALRVGQKLDGEPLPRIPELIDRFVLKGAGSETNVSGEPGDDPAGSSMVPGSGLWWIGYQSRPYPVSLDSVKFEAYLKEEGLESIIEERARRHLSAAPGRERFFRCAKALLEVGQGAVRAKGPGVFDTPLGFTLELVPRKSPYSLSAGDELPLTLTFHGKPVGDALVVAINKDDPGQPVAARTDPKGLVKLRLPHPGFWLVKAVHMESAPPDAGVDWESWWASITFELASPARSARK